MPGLFHKPFRSKSHAKMKSSERRQFLEDLRLRFPGLAGAEDPEIRLLAGDRRCDLFKSKIVNHAEQMGHLYFAGGQPIFYEFDGLLCPTVYALWRLPELASDGGSGVVRITMASGLSHVLQNGADLMAPGLLSGWDAMQPGQICCCAESAGSGGGFTFVAVGRAATSGSELVSSGCRGKAVIVDHVIADHLWLRGDRSGATSVAASSIASSATGNQTTSEVENPADGDANAVEELSTQISVVAVAEEDGGCGGGGVVEVVVASNQDDDCSENEGDPESTVQLADAHLLNCLLHSLLQKIRDKDLPLLCSALLANYMSRYSPSPLNLKATSYRKFGAFAQAMRDDGLLELSNEKGVMSLVSVNRRHPLLLKDPSPTLSFAEFEVSSAAAAAGGSAEGPPAIEDVLFVTAASGELFKRWGHSKGSCLTGKQMRQLMTEYVKAEGLQTPDRAGHVTLDILLSRLVSQSGRPVLADSVPWESLFQLCAASMTPGYRALGRDGSVLLERRGPAPRVTMRVESRASGKSVSLILGLPDFGVDAAQFAKRVQRALSVSANASSASGEVSVQGDQLAYLYKLITEEYAISKKYISGFTPGGKNKKGSAGGKGKGKG